MKVLGDAEALWASQGMVCQHAWSEVDNAYVTFSQPEKFSPDPSFIFHSWVLKQAMSRVHQISPYVSTPSNGILYGKIPIDYWENMTSDITLWSWKLHLAVTFCCSPWQVPWLHSLMLYPISWKFWVNYIISYINCHKNKCFLKDWRRST